jgi:hypothetical protein
MDSFLQTNVCFDWISVSHMATTPLKSLGSYASIIVIHQCGCNLTVASLSCGDVNLVAKEAHQHQLKISYCSS